MKKIEVILIGGGGHAISIMNLIERNFKNIKILGYSDNSKTELNQKYLGSDDLILKKNQRMKLIMAIGTNINLRKKIFEKFKRKNFDFLTIVDKNSVISKSTKICEGSVIFPNSVIGPQAVLEENVVIHSGAVIEHHTIIKKNSYIGPSATICGHSIVNKNCLIGASSCVIENIIIPENSILGAGSVLVKNYKKGKTLIGVPAK